MNLAEQDNKYNELVANHLKQISNTMFSFELTKCCNYSTLVFLYKEDKVSDLFLQVAKHFGCKTLVSLYIIGLEGERIIIPFNSSTTLREYIFEQQHILKPIYDIPLPVVYRIYLDDGHSHEHEHQH